MRAFSCITVMAIVVDLEKLWRGKVNETGPSPFSWWIWFV